MNVFIVSSPFQYICANEARDFFSTKNNILILKTKQGQLGKKQFNNIIIESEWDYIIKQPDSGRLLSIPRIVKKIKKIAKENQSNFGCLFFSQYKCMLTNLIKRNVTFNRHMYFDDGTVTLEEYEEYIKNKKPYSRYRVLDDILIQLQGLKKIGCLEYNEKLEMFSIFDIPKPTCKLHKNKLIVLREKTNAKKCFDVTGPVGFIGEGAFGCVGVISEEEYFIRLKEICAKHNKVIYFPHRAESQRIKEKVNSINNIIYHTPDFPIELEISKNEIKLSKIYGVASTAMYTLSIIYKEIPLEITNTSGLKNFLSKETYEHLVSYFNI